MHPLDEDFEQVLRMKDTVRSSDGEDLINFSKWVAVASHVDQILQYQLPTKVPADDAVSAYLMAQLSQVTESCEFELTQRASEIRVEEREVERKNLPAMRRLGF